MKKDKDKTKIKEPKPKAPPVPLAERLSNYICPMLLGGAVCFAVIYALYRPFAAFCTAIFLAAELVLFIFFDKIKTIRFLGGIIYTVMLIACSFGAMSIMFSEARVAGWDSPMNWFYGEEGSYTLHTGFLTAVMLGGGFFLISILYYFTQIRYRSLGVMLCIMFPFVIYAKRADAMPDVLVTVMISLFLAVMVHNRRIDPSVPKERRGVLVVNTAYIISVAVFVSVTGAITMMIDKPTYFSKLEKDSSYFDYYQTDATGSGDLDSLQNESSDRRGGLNYTYNPIFYLETDGTQPEYYLRRQVYDKFNGSVWENEEDFDSYSVVYSSVIPEYAEDDILADMKEVSAEDSSFLSPEKYKSAITTRHGRVFDETFAPYYLPAPLGVITDNGTLEELEYRKYPQTTVIRASALKADNSGTQIPALDDSFDFLEYGAGLTKYVKDLNMTGDEYISKLTELSDNGSAAARRLLFDYNSALIEYYDINKVSDRLVQLAYEVTKDCKSDYEKALALESYFTNEGFLYSLEYVPEDDSIDYFVFESKTGYCVAFATAMTLMARSVGLPARYVEGFAAFEYTDDGSIVVRDGHAHAFVEVYIPGAGWMTFDPTVSDYRDTPTGDDGGFGWQTFLTIISRFILVIIVGFVIIFVVLLDRIVELIFRIRLRFADPAKGVLMLYANVIKLVNLSTKDDYSAYTVKMLRSYLYETRTVCPEKLLTLFERTAFGGYVPTAEEFSEAYEDYKRCYKYLRKLPSAKTLAKLRAGGTAAK